MKIVYCCLLVFISIGIFNNANSQHNTDYEKQNFKPLTPNAFQFLKYTEMPVSEYTGIPNISIPLYEIDVDGVKIPIGLTYHANGIRVSQEASWVGLGWDMSFGSVVQIINDEDDLLFGDNTVPFPHVRMRPDYHFSPYPEYFPLRFQYPYLGLNGQGWFTPYPVHLPQKKHACKIATDYYVPVNGEFNIQRENLFTARWFDSEPDIFKVSFLGHSFNFTIDHGNNEIIILNKRGYNVTKHNGNWKIETPTGDTYFFEEKSIVESWSINSVSGGTPGNISSVNWFLTKIITKNKKEVVINYSKSALVENYPSYSEKWVKPTLLSSVQYSNPSHVNRIIGYNGIPSGIASLVNSHIVSTLNYSKEAQVHPSQILFPSGQINFITSNRIDVNEGKKLDKIEILSNDLIKLFNFNYNYFDASNNTGNGFIAANNSNTTHRLKLTSVIEQSGAKYEFKYNQTVLPKKNSFAQDYWGYYNGNHGNASLIPNPTQFNKPELGNNGNNKGARTEFAKAGILEEILYPTGGSTKFEYELNTFDNYWVPDYSDNNNTISSGLGLRVKTILFSTDVSTINKKIVYSYIGGKAATKLDFFRFYNINVGTIYNNFSQQGYLNWQTFKLDQISAAGYYSSNLFGSGTAVGYNYVTKQEFDLAGNNLGKIESHYTNEPDKVDYTAQYSIQADVVLPAIKDDYYPQNGLLKTVKYFDISNQLIKKIDQEFTNKSSNLLYAAKILPLTNIFYTDIDPHWFSVYMKPQNLIAYYPIYDFETLLSKTTTTEYNQGIEIVNVSELQYDGINRLIRKVDKNSTTAEEVEIGYPQFTPSGNTVYDKMVNRNRLLDVVSYTKSKWLDNNGFSKKPLYRYIKDYVEIGDKIVEDKVTFYNPYPYDVITNQITYNQYDPTNANLLEFTSKGVTNAHIWGYSGNLLTAEVINATAANIAYTSFETQDKGNWSYSGRTDFDISAPTGIRSINLNNNTISKTGLALGDYIVSYWSKNGPYSVNNQSFNIQGKTINGWTYYEHSIHATEIQVLVNGSIDELRLYPKGGMMTTYTYRPLIGISSICDANNTISYYEYDNFNRLNIIRNQDKNILKKYCYNYSGQIENCNTIFGNVHMTQLLYPLCPEGFQAPPFSYTVPANTFTSTVSQAHANQLAMDHINTQGYAAANATCSPIPTCNAETCNGEDKKCINGNCETGIKVYTDTYYEAGTWFCTYHYEFSDGSWSTDFQELSGSACF